MTINGYKTYIGILIAAVPTVANLFGYSVTPQMLSDIPAVAESLFEIVGLSIALIGRLMANTPGWLAIK